MSLSPGSRGRASSSPVMNWELMFPGTWYAPGVSCPAMVRGRESSPGSR